MSVSSSQASLKAVRADLDLSEAGSIRERAVLNKVNKTGGNIILSEFKGNVLGQQLIVDTAPMNNESSWKKKRYEGSGHTFLTATGNVFVTETIKVGITARPSGGDSISGDDRGHEYRVIGRCDENGTYRLTGMSFGRFDGSSGTTYNNGQLHVMVVSHSSGWLSGTSTTNYYAELTKKNGGRDERAWSETFTLSTSLPYVTLILRNIQKAGGSYSQTWQHDFWNFRIEKV